MCPHPVSDWIWEVNEKAVYTYASPKVLDILGYKPEEVIGKTPFDLMPPEEAKRVAEIFSSIAASQKPFKELENANHMSQPTKKSIHEQHEFYLVLIFFREFSLQFCSHLLRFFSEIQKPQPTMWSLKEKAVF